MKKLLFILAMCIGTSVFAQNSFPTENAIWNQEVVIGDVEHNKLFGLKGNITINDTLYGKLYALSDTTLDCINEQTPGYGLIRNEGQKVFFKPSYWKHSDILLYDFGAKVGDTVWHNAAIAWEIGDDYFYGFIFYPADHYSVIYDIRIENNIKKYYTYTYRASSIYPAHLAYHEWYEGIGSHRGLFSPLINHIRIPLFVPFPEYLNLYLRCFKHNDTVKYLVSAGCNKCFCPQDTVGISDNKIDDNNLIIYPNPTNSEFKVQSSKFRMQSSEFKVFDVMGRVQRVEYKIENEELKINISHLPSGIYFFQLDNEVFKIIKN